MRRTQLIMGMPIALELPDDGPFVEAFELFRQIDRQFSTYKPGSEVSRYDRGELSENQLSADLTQVLSLCEQMRQKTEGYFDIRHGGHIDPSGLVKGWAIGRVRDLLDKLGVPSFQIDAGGDLFLRGHNLRGTDWRIGLKDPKNPSEVSHIVAVRDLSVATSGEYERGRHIYNPHGELPGSLSATVIGPEPAIADAFATALFARGRGGLASIEKEPGYEALITDAAGSSTTSSFSNFLT